ncbi:hypothetical protein BDV95DRAFT_629891 [Massariosphaeria phaeospora]|uniref:Uncharacterized protein n=1 Tax=Massariosphaeria phaeospora TaxID=100035 RepID=A0A7C8I2Q8_9PLEO|nr:hypothetical protein BDV95DRAFT_629891 [Massariosphaeria phaeospora]
MENREQHQAMRIRQSGNSEGLLPPSQAAASTTASSPSSPPGRQQHSEESWVEIESRPSSSSLSSAAEEIITTGLRVQHDSNNHRHRRRSRGAGQFHVGTGYRVTNAAGGSSSQEEYEESESESDRVMTSSNEGISSSPLLQHELRRGSRNPHSVASSETMSEREGDDEDDDDENATAVNYPRSSRRQFEPLPNAFSHPPTQPMIRDQSGTTTAPRRPQARPGAQRHSFPQHSPYNVMAPNYQPDHDEALRASLSTLLSAAAAVRGLPKPGQTRSNHPPSSSRIDPTSLRLVPESVALGDIAEDTGSNRVSSPRTASSDPSDRSKRRATSAANPSVRSSSKDRRAVKKARRTGLSVDQISPTLLTWIAAAGFVFLVSAYSAGYVNGKKAGHAEAIGQIGAAGSEAGRCGNEAASGVRGPKSGLRRLWTSGVGGVPV